MLLSTLLITAPQPPLLQRAASPSHVRLHVVTKWSPLRRTDVSGPVPMLSSGPCTTLVCVRRPQTLVVASLSIYEHNYACLSGSWHSFGNHGSIVPVWE